MTTTATRGAALGLALVLASAGGALADDPAAEAKQHVDRASELHKAGQLEEALAELKTAFALDPRPPLLFAMGQIHVQLGQCAHAIVYYERFLATRPRADLADVTREAIATCKTNPPPVPPPDSAPSGEPPTVTAPPPALASAVVARPPAATVAVHATAPPRPWYTDYVGDALVGGGVAAGLVAKVMWRGAVADRDAAVDADSYERFDTLIDRSHTKQTTAIVVGIGAGALVTAGVLRYVLHDRGERRSDVALVPARGGATLAWARRF